MCATELIVINTHIPQDYKGHIEDYNIKMRLLPFYEDIADSYAPLDEPTLKLTFNDSLGRFGKDLEYDKEFKSIYERIRGPIEGRAKMRNQNFSREYQDEEDIKEYFNDALEEFNRVQEERLKRIHGKDYAAHQQQMKDAENRKQAAGSKEPHVEVEEDPEPEWEVDPDKVDTTKKDTSEIVKDTVNESIDDGDGPSPIESRDRVSDDEYLKAKEQARKDSIDAENERKRLLAEAEAKRIRDSIREANKLDPSIIDEELIDTTLEVDNNALQKDINKETSEVTDQEKKQELANIVKRTIEFVEMYEVKHQNHTEINNIAKAENNNKELYITNQVIKAKSKRKLLEIIAEAKTDLKKQANSTP